MIEDNDDHILVRPAPSDPISAFRGSLSQASVSSDEARRLAREEESRIERRKERTPAKVILLDAQALIALARGEPAATEVEEILRGGDAAICAVNLLEAADYFMRREGWSEVATQATLTQLVDEALAVLEAGRDVVWRGALLRARHYSRRSRELSLADCVLLASAGVGDSIATSDRAVAAVARSEEISLVPLADATGRRP